jgi:micrococcal nuclease
MPHQKIKTLLIGSLLLCTASLSQADFFRWTDELGKTHYSDRPTHNSKKLNIDAGQSFYQVKKVYDGDTITLKGGLKVRLLGINTPEIESRHRQGEPGGIAAKNWLKKQLHNQKIRLEKGRTKQDKYGRVLAHLFTKEGRHLNLELVKEGLATVNIHPPNLNYSTALLNAQKEAERDRRGIWALTAYQPLSIHEIGARQQRGWGRFMGKIKRLKKGRKFDRLIVSKNITLRIPTKNRSLFPPLSQYVGKLIEIRGWPSRRKSHYSILVRHPSALIIQ